MTRAVVPYTPHHVIHRGHNRSAVFVHADDYRFYLGSLHELKTQFNVEVFAWCLKINHVHMVLQIGAETHALGQLMKCRQAPQTRYVNTIEGRSRILRESCYRSSPIETDLYLLACCRYIEVNPARAGVVPAPQKYPWSSYRYKAGLVEQEWIYLDPVYLGLGIDKKQRIQRYRHFVSQGSSTSEQTVIRASIQRGQLTGSDKFVDEVECRLQIRVEHRGPETPRRKNKSVPFFSNERMAA